MTDAVEPGRMRAFPCSNCCHITLHRGTVCEFCYADEADF